MIERMIAEARKIELLASVRRFIARETRTLSRVDWSKAEDRGAKKLMLDNVRSLEALHKAESGDA